MIQRIQTIYLLLAALLMGATFICPLLDFVNDAGETLAVDSLGIGGQPAWGILTFAALSALAALVNIFMYKNRKRQIKICLATALLIIIYYVTAMVYLNAFLSKIEMSYTLLSVQVGIVLPAIALLFDLLAMWKIKKDEKLIKSLDRIR